MKYFISAGEASGDLHAGRLIAALREADPRAQFMFLGGDEMAAAAGHGPVTHYRDMAFMGFSEVLRNLRKISGNFSTARRALRAMQPDALILVDYPSFNLRLAKEAKKLGIPVYYYIAPKVWAWKSWRVKTMRRLVRRIYSILPFEPAWFGERGVDVEYVGNPSVGEIRQRIASLPSREEFCRIHGLDPEREILALVPGSRRGEIRCNLPVMQEVASRHPSMQAVVAGAPAISSEIYRSIAPEAMILTDATTALMRHARAALVTSGTATLECALSMTPQVACYRANGSRLSYNIMKRLIKCPFVTLPNLIAGREVIPEMLVHLCTPDAVDARLRPLLGDTDERRSQLEGYRLMSRNLATADSAATTANRIITDLNKLKGNA